MARTKDTVQESLRSLRELEESYDGTRQHPKILMLRLLKENPGRTFSDLQPVIGRSERCLQRWWHTYRTDGINALLVQRPIGGQRPRRIDEEKLAGLKERARTEGFGDLAEIQGWLREQNVSYSRSGLWNLMRNTVGAQPRGWLLIDDDSPRLAPTSPISAENKGIPAHVIEFLNSMPTHHTAREWITQFRDALLKLLGDVDRIVITVNLECRLRDPDNYRESIIINQTTSTNNLGESNVTVSKVDALTRPSARTAKSLEDQGFPIKSYHPPVGFDYYFSDDAYLGVILLLNKKERHQVTSEVQALFEQIRPFVVFALSDIVARHQSDREIDSVFYAALMNMVTSAKLTEQEARIATLQLMGHSYKEMAHQLSISLDTVKKHFKEIHRKTGTHGQAELFAKYFSSRLSSLELPVSGR